MGKKRTHQVNYRKKPGKIKQNISWLNADAKAKPELGTPIEIGKSILSVIQRYKDSPMNSFDMGFGKKFENALKKHEDEES